MLEQLENSPRFATARENPNPENFAIIGQEMCRVVRNVLHSENSPSLLRRLCKVKPLGQGELFIFDEREPGGVFVEAGASFANAKPTSLDFDRTLHELLQNIVAAENAMLYAVLAASAKRVAREVMLVGLIGLAAHVPGVAGFLTSRSLVGSLARQGMTPNSDRESFKRGIIGRWRGVPVMAVDAVANDPLPPGVVYALGAGAGEVGERIELFSEPFHLGYVAKEFLHLGFARDTCAWINFGD